MASSNLNVTACIKNKSVNDGIMCATFNYEEKISVSHTNVEISDYLVDSDLKNLSLYHVGDDDAPASVSTEGKDKVDNEICDISPGFNKTFDARKIKDDNEFQGVILDKTVKLMKPGNLSLQFDSEESLGIISDVLDDNATLDLLIPFKSKERNSVQLIKKTANTNLLAFSPLHLRNSSGVYFADNDSPMLCRYTSTPEPLSSKPELKNSDMRQDFPTEGMGELDFIEPEKCYEDFTKGNIIASTSKVSLLNDCLNKIEAAPFLPNDLRSENNKVHFEKNDTIEVDSANQSPLCLNTTFAIKSEPLKEVKSVSELQIDKVSASFEEIPNNNTYTFDNMNITAEVNITKDLPEEKEPNPSHLIKVISSCLPISEIDKSKQNGHDSYIKSPKPNAEAKKSLFKRSIAMPIQKPNLSKKENLNTRFNSTFCTENNEPLNNNPTKLDKRCSLGSSLRIPGKSQIGFVKKHSLPKLNQACVSNYKGCKLSEVKTHVSTGSAITVGKSVVSPIQQKNLHNTSLSRTTAKPKVVAIIKKPNGEEKVSLNNTFTKDNRNIVLSPIIEKENQCAESEEEDIPHVEKICKLSPSKTGIEDKKIPIYKQSESTNNCAPIGNENKRSISNKCLKKPSVQTKGNHQGSSTSIPFPRKIQQFNEKLVLSKKNNEGVVLGGQNINSNGKCNLTQTIKDQQFSKLPTFGSTFSKKLIPTKVPKVNGRIPIDSKVLPNQRSNASKSKPSVQSTRCLRAPEIFISKERKS